MRHIGLVNNTPPTSSRRTQLKFDERSFTLKAESKEQRDEWVKSIRRAHKVRKIQHATHA